MVVCLFVSLCPHHTANEILVPGPGIEPMPPAVEAQSLSHWTAREAPNAKSFKGPGAQQREGFVVSASGTMLGESFSLCGKWTHLALLSNKASIRVVKLSVGPTQSSCTACRNYFSHPSVPSGSPRSARGLMFAQHPLDPREAHLFFILIRSNGGRWACPADAFSLCPPHHPASRAPIISVQTSISDEQTHGIHRDSSWNWNTTAHPQSHGWLS